MTDDGVLASLVSRDVLDRLRAAGYVVVERSDLATVVREAEGHCDYWSDPYPPALERVRVLVGGGGE